MQIETDNPHRRRALAGLPLALALAGVATWLALAPAALGAPVAVTQSTTAPAKAPVSATVEQCVTSPNPAERSVTFAGEMAAIPGAVKLEMRIEVLERLPREIAFHGVSSPGLGIWRTAAPGVKNYRDLSEITNLAAPASYRAAVRFRWLNAKGRLIRATELKTPRCEQPAGAGVGHKAVEEPAPAG